jgi:hypothetical protein
MAAGRADADRAERRRAPWVGRFDGTARAGTGPQHAQPMSARGGRRIHAAIPSHLCSRRSSHRCSPPAPRRGAAPPRAARDGPGRRGLNRGPRHAERDQRGFLVRERARIERLDLRAARRLGLRTAPRLSDKRRLRGVRAGPLRAAVPCDIAECSDAAPGDPPPAAWSVR